MTSFITPSGSKEKILRRIREGLQLPAPARHCREHGSSHSCGSAPEVATDTEQWLPPVPEDLEGQIALFISISKELKTDVIRCSTKKEISDKIVEISTQENWSKIFTHTHPLLDAVIPDLGAVKIQKTDGGYDIPDLESAEAGITGCECLIAQTASILVTPQSSGGRVLSVLPPHHLVIASTQQIVRDLKVAFEHVKTTYGEKLPRYISFITGPSRTGDIERILVLGAHGPKKLTVLLLDELP